MLLLLLLLLLLSCVMCVVDIICVSYISVSVLMAATQDTETHTQGYHAGGFLVTEL